jgi:hypothetical protein
MLPRCEIWSLFTINTNRSSSVTRQDCQGSHRGLRSAKKQFINLNEQGEFCRLMPAAGQKEAAGAAVDAAAQFFFSLAPSFSFENTAVSVPSICDRASLSQKCYRFPRVIPQQLSRAPE